MKANYFKGIITAAALLLTTLAVYSSSALAAATPKKVTNPVILPPIVNQVKVNVKTDCGAKGDGETNDTAAFAKAAEMIEEKGGGTLIIPKGTYIVGKQTHAADKYPYIKQRPFLL